MVFVPGRRPPEEHLDRGVLGRAKRQSRALHETRSSLQAKRHSRADYPTFDKWYRKTHKRVFPVLVSGMPTAEAAEVKAEAEKVAEESHMHDPVSHPFSYPKDRVSNINKKISISIKFPDGMRIAKTGISFTELKHLIERLEVVC